ncbi:MAG: DUF3373 family protein [Campylobacterota bacterium]|nr:DUF3373 family protein [Campylobacterota bacterium]
MRIISTVTAFALLASVSMADEAVDYQKQIDDLTKKITKLEKNQKRQKKTLSEVKAHDAYDNIKFGVDFRNAVDVLEYKNNETGETASNDSLLTSRLYLTMKSAPMSGLVFMGKLAIYSTWGAHVYDESNGLKDWSASSKATDTIMRIKEAYFVYSNEIGEQPWSVSVGRRPSTNGFLANYRENETSPGSPLAHITNMEVNAAMLKLNWDRFVEGSYSKFVYGRAHSGEANGVYGLAGERLPFAEMNTDEEDENVDFFVFLGDGYNNGQYQLMYQWAHIFNTKGQDLTPDPDGNNPKGIKNAAGAADLFSLALKIDGVGDEISDFLDETILFISGAYTNYSAKDGYSLIGSEDGGSEAGSSLWLGAVFPDMITDSGKFGLEYNYGSQYWTPMTWAEDTATGSKIAVRGSAYEAYWNFNLFGVKYLPSQIRYTYAQHDYTPNINCAGWIAPEKVDMTSQDLRFAVSYRY